MEQGTQTSLLDNDDDPDDLPPAPPPAEVLGPTVEEWQALSPVQRDAWLDRMVNELRYREEEELQTMAEGDPHRDACDMLRDTLRSYFERRQLSIYVGAGIPVCYPRVKSFSPDVMVATEVRVGKRMAWIVAEEGKGPELVIEVHHKGSWRKDFVDNVKTYAQRGIREYFAFDMNRGVLAGWRLSAEGKRYQPMKARRGWYRSEVLDMEVGVVGDSVRFLVGTAQLLTPAEQAAQERERAEQERERAEQERERAEQERERAEQALEQLRAARADSIVQVLKLRQIAAGEEVLARITGCQDIDLLDRWFQQAVTASPEEFLALFHGAGSAD